MCYVSAYEKGRGAASLKATGKGSGQVVDGDRFSSNRDIVLHVRRANAFRWVTVTLAAISWLAVSNHCALGLAAVENHGVEVVGEHDCCASDVPAQPKPAKDPATPCCKTLPATSAIPAKAFQANVVLLSSAPLDSAAVILAEPPHPIGAFRFRDTGPPGGRTFAESVLQRSLLAHAPPFLA